MIKLLTIVGARPQIIKAAAISRAVRTQFAGQIEEHILHTGQHYDDNMSEVFFRELGIPEPDYNLHVGSGSHGVQTARIIEGIEAVLNGERMNGKNGGRNDGMMYDGVIVYGDTNSTLAAAVAAAKIHVPVYHIEAGLRSFNMAMPEEQNRIVCDALSTILFAPTETAVRNLQGEGFSGEGLEVRGERTPIKNRVRFADGRGQKVVLSGDVMYDNALYFAPKAEEKSDIIERLGLKKKQFVLATIHRPANTDNARNLRSIFRALSDIAASGMDVVFPCHPRTRERLRALMNDGMSATGSLNDVDSPHFHLIEPVGFYDIIRLEKEARVVMTDSGGVQKEAFFYGTPSVILRPETEWVEIVDAGAGILADADYERIMAAYEALNGREVKFPPLFGDGHASERILREIVNEV